MCVCGLKLIVKVPTNSLGKDFPCGFTVLLMLQFWKEDVFRWSSHSLHSFPRLNDSYKVFCYLVFLHFFAIILTYCCVINALQPRDLKHCYSVSKSCLALQPHGLQHTRLPCPHCLLDFAQIHVHPVGGAIQHLIPCCLLLLLSVFPASGSFPVSQPFTSGGQNVIFSFSINLSNEHPGLISLRIDWLDLLCSPRDPQESSPTPQFFSAHPLYGPTLTSVHDCWKNRSFGDMDLCQQGEVSAF